MSTALALAALLLAQPTPTTTEAPEATPKPEEGRPRLAVMALSPGGLDAEFVASLTESIATTIDRTGVFETISPTQIKSLLAYEKRRDALGDCVNEDCYAQVADVVRANQFVTGSVARVGDELVLNLVLIDRKAGKAIKRATRQEKNAADLMRAAEQVAIVVLQPILGARRGFVRVNANVPDAQLTIDDKLRPEGVGQVIPLAAGPHAITVSKDGWYTAKSTVLVQPGRVGAQDFTLIPAKETIEAYESSANLMRIGAWGTGALAVAGAVVATIFYNQATDDKLAVDNFVNSTQEDQAIPGARSGALVARDDFTTHQALYLTGLGTAAVAGVTSAILFFAGDDPDKYDEFETLSAQGPSDGGELAGTLKPAN